MTRSALVFMIASWTFVLGLTLWSFVRVMGHNAGSDKEKVRR
jgi:hypothetical protein